MDPRSVLQALVARSNPGPEALLRSSLFDLQQGVVDDVLAGAPNVGILCGRRSGKTSLLARLYFLVALLFPGSLGLYLAITRKLAKLQFWPELLAVNSQYRLGAKPNTSDLTLALPNGSWIWSAGADDEGEINKYRGFKFKLASLDECGSHGAYLKALMTDVIEPGLMDASGTLLVAGTPAMLCRGEFYEATFPDGQADFSQRRWRSRAGYSVHHWTCMQNPHLPHAAAWLEAKRRDRGWKLDDPRYLREWMGIWIDDHSSLVYRYDATKSDYGTLPAHHDWEHVMGVDFGYDDATAFVILAHASTCPDVYLIHAWQKTEMIPAQIGDRLREYINSGRYRFSRIVGDTGGLGKSFVEEFRQRYDVPIIAAQKQHKHEYIELLNSDLATGRLRVKRDSPVALEWGQLPWDEDRRKEADAYPNHYADACLYAWREARHFAATPILPPPTTRDEVLQREAEEIEQRAVRRHQERNWDYFDDL